MASKAKRKHAQARVTEDVHAILTDEEATETFGQLVQELGRWMIRRNLTFDQAYTVLMTLFYAPDSALDTARNPK